MGDRMVITDAKAQCGTEPPYNLVNVPTRMLGDMPQVKIEGEWIDFPKDGPRPEITRYHHMPCVGITTSWEYDHGPRSY